MTKIDAFAHILPPAYAERMEALWIHPTRSPIWSDYPVEERADRQ